MRERYSQVAGNQATNGMTTDDLAATAYDTFSRVTEAAPARFPDIVEIDRIAWKEVAALAAYMLKQDSDAVVELSASRLAKNLYSQFCLSRSAVPEWETQDQNVRLAWEVVGRHLLNVIDSDGNVDLDDFTSKAVEWYKSRAA